MTELEHKITMFIIGVIRFILILILASLMWLIISSTIQRFKTPELTETQLALRLHKSFVCNWYD